MVFVGTKKSLCHPLMDFFCSLVPGGVDIWSVFNMIFCKLWVLDNLSSIRCQTTCPGVFIRLL